MNAGENIRKLREKNDFTQAQLAHMSGLDEKYISVIERGVRNPGKKALEKLCDAFGVDEQTIRYGERADTTPKPELERRLIEEIEKVIFQGKPIHRQLEIAAMIMKVLHEENHD